MNDDPMTRSLVRDLGIETDSNTLERAERLQKTTDAIDGFFENLDLQMSMGKSTTSEPSSPTGLNGYLVSDRDAFELDRVRNWDETLNFLKATRAEVKRGMTKSELRASLQGVLRKFANSL